MHLKDLVNEVLRKIGRNMMLFQKLEHLLKYVVSNGNISGYSSELEDIKVRQAASVSKQTMGQLVGQYTEFRNPELETPANEPDNIKEAYFSFSFSIETDSKEYTSKKEALAQLVNQRNELIHHLLPSFDVNSQTSCEDLSNRLDMQSEVIRIEIKELQGIAEALIEGRNEIASYLSSDEGRKQLEQNYLRQSKLAYMLCDIADQLANEDGWVSMSLAGQLIKRHVPDELALLREHYGFKTLKSFMIATEMFEIQEDLTPKGGVRVVYKLNSDLEGND